MKNVYKGAGEPEIFTLASSPKESLFDPTEAKSKIFRSLNSDFDYLKGIWFSESMKPTIPQSLWSKWGSWKLEESNSIHVNG